MIPIDRAVIGSAATLVLATLAAPTSMGGGSHPVVFGRAFGTYATAQYSCAVEVVLNVRAATNPASFSMVDLFHGCPPPSIPAGVKSIDTHSLLTGSWETGWSFEGESLGCVMHVTITIGSYGNGRAIPFRHTAFRDPDSVNCPNFVISATFDAIG